MRSSSTSSTTRLPSCRRSSMGGARMPPVRRATVVTHGVTRNVDKAVSRLAAVAEGAGVELVDGGAEAGTSDIAVCLGGDGTILRALTRFLGTGVPVIG